MKRIIAFLSAGGSVSKLRKDAKLRRRVAAFLNNPETEPKVPKFVRRSFCLPPNWPELLQDEAYMDMVVRNTLISQYSVKLGFKLESIIGELITDLGYSWEKGSVFAVDNKEVDLAIPNRTNPRLLLMVSYQVTTASSQTSKANEQAAMYDSVKRYNRQRSQQDTADCLFVNVVDGGGWISRKKDLRHLHTNCDYCFSHGTLNDLRELIATTMTTPANPEWY